MLVFSKCVFIRYDGIFINYILSCIIYKSRCNIYFIIIMVLKIEKKRISLVYFILLLHVFCAHNLKPTGKSPIL